MRTLNVYKKYNPVKHDYIKQLPQNWQLLPNVAIFQERKEKGTEGEEPLSISAIKGIIKSSDYEDRKDRTSEDKSEYLLVKEGDIAYNTMLMWAGAVGYSRYRGIVSPAYTVLKAKKGAEINPKFFHYQFRTEYYKNYSKRFSYGIIDSRLRLYYVNFKRMYSIVPPLEIQNRIVNFLDYKMSKINHFIKIGQLLIGRTIGNVSIMEEYKLRLIEDAITGRIDLSDFNYHNVELEDDSLVELESD
jgi:type I restriction enzyme, S subunit